MMLGFSSQIPKFPQGESAEGQGTPNRNLCVQVHHGSTHHPCSQAPVGGEETPSSRPKGWGKNRTLVATEEESIYFFSSITVFSVLLTLRSPVEGNIFQHHFLQRRDGELCMTWTPSAQTLLRRSAVHVHTSTGVHTQYHQTPSSPLAAWLREGTRLGRPRSCQINLSSPHFNSGNRLP